MKGVGPIGQRVFIEQVPKFRESYSVTLLTSLSHGLPVFVSTRKNSNNQVDFLKFVMAAVVAGYIKQGDILICDNASIHHGKLIQDDLKELQALVGFEMKFLPTYSPELNPCELVFNMVKGWLRRNKQEDADLQMSILEAFSFVTIDSMIRFYKHCQENTIGLNWDFLKHVFTINESVDDPVEQ